MCMQKEIIPVENDDDFFFKLIWHKYTDFTILLTFCTMFFQFTPEKNGANNRLTLDKIRLKIKNARKTKPSVSCVDSSNDSTKEKRSSWLNCALWDFE